MTFIGINGFGRIGKCLFLQLINNKDIIVNAINAPDFDISKMEHYLKYDSVHKYNTDFTIEILDNNNFKLNGRKIHVFKTRNASEIDWKKYDIYHIIDSSGIYLNKEKAAQHNVPYVIMSAPPKDDTPLFVYGANHEKYNNQKIVSNASCTTNCIVPVLKHLNDAFGIKHASFTTIHASTSSQKVVDTLNSNSRTNRSVLNNIIPHSTGASSSIYKILPELEGKIKGTSVRVPVSNVSLVDLNISLEKETTMEEIFKTFEDNIYIQVANENHVSSDFISTKCPSIIDKRASMELNKNEFKLLIWYDNEWSYTSQLISLFDTIIKHEVNPYYIEKQDYFNKEVVLRLDLNVPVTDNVVTSDYRIISALPTIKRILKDNPKRLIIMSHLGRPSGVDESKSLIIVLPILKKCLNIDIEFLSNGLTKNTLTQLKESANNVFLLENLRFHDEETRYNKMENSDNNEAISVIRSLGNHYVNDAFGCLHRDHLSINGLNIAEKSYGFLVNKELNALNNVTNSRDKTLAIIGGGKIQDKLAMLEKLSQKVDHIFIAGGNINSILKNEQSNFLPFCNNKAEISFMIDGLCATSLESNPSYSLNENLPVDMNFYDMGMKSMNILRELIKNYDTIFWNGTLGVVENHNYKQGSEMLVHILMENNEKNVIIGGGDTGGFVNNYQHNFNHISTGGGASIEYISNGQLVGLIQFMS